MREASSQTREAYPALQGNELTFVRQRSALPQLPPVCEEEERAVDFDICMATFNVQTLGATERTQANPAKALSVAEQLAG